MSSQFYLQNQSEPEPTFEFTTERISELILNKLNSWMETAVSMLPNVLLAILVIILFFMIGLIVRRGTAKAFQDLAENLLAGVFLSIRKPFLPGHLIDSNGQLGFVQKLNLRNTIIKDFDSQTIYIPNKEVFKNVLENYSQSGLRRIEIPVGVSYGEALEEVEKTLKQAIETLDFRAKETGVEVWALEFGDSSINFSVRYWVPYPEGQIPYFQAISEGVKSIKSHLDKAGIQIPFPIRTLDFGIKGGRPLSESLSGLSASVGNANETH